MMAMVYVGYCFVDTYEWVVILGVIYGAGNGVYIAVDYALAVDCLPSQASASTLSTPPASSSPCPLALWLPGCVRLFPAVGASRSCGLSCLRPVRARERKRCAKVAW